ncbi:hypothetical protein CTEN210_18426 [Chaetoceros tenuissimus]|uniref:Centromere protein S n=1 Tax=Chaetoceros tenuissimus TaxID=426638 RepID=A0AAD3DEK4_9STRA|nr:hypothetical protein CTEN210_18426 [Chaetoceros tenuissimus]
MNSNYSDNDNDSVTSSSNQHDTKEAHEALHNAIGNMCNPNSNNPLSISLTAQSHSQKKIISKKGMEALTQLTFEYSQLLSRDLVAFSKHANRKTITLDDVKLCLRRNDNMLQKLNNHLQNQQEERMMEIRMGEGMQFMDQITKNVNHGNDMNHDVAKHASDLDNSDDDDDEIDFAVRKSSESDISFDMQVDVDSSSDSSDEEDALTKRSEQIKSSRLKMSCKNDSDSDDDDFMKQLEKSKKGHESVMKAKTNSLNAIELDSD